MYTALPASGLPRLDWVGGARQAPAAGVWTHGTALLPPLCQGNLLRTYDGRLAYLDFGMMGQIDGNIRR